MTPADILAILHAYPQAAAEALRGFHTAYPWVDGAVVEQSYRPLRSWGTPHTNAVVYYLPPEEAGLPGCPASPGWYTADETRYDTREAAKAAVDAELRAEGFHLFEDGA